MPLPTNRNKMYRYVSVLILVALLAILISGVAKAAPFNDDSKAALTNDNKPPLPPARSDLNPPVAPKLFPKPSETGVSPPPPVLADLEEQTQGEEGRNDQLGLQIRGDAMREAGLSYGARGGLAFRTYEIQRRLAEYDTSMSKTYDFNRLLIAEASGLLVEPPVVSEADRAVIVKAGGQAAAVADRVYRINKVARIVTGARNWRLYLERDWGRVDPPPAILLPRDDIERAAWREYVKQGWEEGVRQAEETFEADLDRMTADYLGMIRYRELLAQGMITPPFTLADERGITGGGSEMRIGDRGLSITGQSQLVPQGNKWTPAPR
jgi:defect in organelle trafficking protein DotC